MARFPALRKGSHQLWLQLASPGAADRAAWQSAGLSGAPDLQWELVVPDEGALRLLVDPAQDRGLLLRESGLALEALLPPDATSRVVDLAKGVLP